MSKPLTLLLTLFVYIVILEKSWAVEVNADNQQIVTALWHKINSEILGETRDYSVYLPISYTQNDSKRYPVLYVTDGHSTKMRGIAGMLESLANHELNSQVPEMIVVAIPSSNRNFDFSPTKADLSFNGQLLQEMKTNSGGAKNFSRFILEELVVHVNSVFRTNESRGIVGMSLGGLFVADILLTAPNSFTHYLIADPTSIWDDNYINKSFSKAAETLSKARANVFFGIANNDHLGELGITNRNWTNDLIDSLEKVNNPNLNVSSKYFSEEQHGTVMFLAFYYGLLDLYSKSTT